MTNNFSERRASLRMPTEIQGKIDDESCYISNLSDGGVMLQSAFNGKVGQEVTIRFTFNMEFFEKKGVIRAVNSMPSIRTSAYKNKFMYSMSVAFMEAVSDKDFFLMDI